MYAPDRFEVAMGPSSGGSPSREGFYLFMLSKDPEERFNWSSCYECAIAQYAKTCNMDYFELGKHIGTHGLHAWNNVVSDGRWTFGEAAMRFDKFMRTGEVETRQYEWA